MSKKYQPTSLQHLTAGQPLKISASTWNAFVQHIESSNEDDAPFEESNDNSTVIICKNSTNADIPAFTMVSLETPVLPSGYNGLGKLYNATMTLSAIPTEEDVIGVTQELVEAGASGYVLISGITPLQLGSSPYDHPYASPDGTGGFTFHDDYGTARILHVIGNNALVLIGASPSAGGAAGDYYQGYFKLSISEKSRQVENPDYDPTNPDSPQYITEYYSEAHHSGGRYTVNGQVGSMLGGDVAGDLGATLQDVILHYHVNNGDAEDLTPTGAYVELASLQSNSLTDSYWLIGQASVDGVVQQSHGVPALLWFGCREEPDQSVSESESEVSAV